MCVTALDTHLTPSNHTLSPDIWRQSNRSGPPEGSSLSFTAEVTTRIHPLELCGPAQASWCWLIALSHCSLLSTVTFWICWTPHSGLLSESPELPPFREGHKFPSGPHLSPWVSELTRSCHHQSSPLWSWWNSLRENHWLIQPCSHCKQNLPDLILLLSSCLLLLLPGFHTVIPGDYGISCGWTQCAYRNNICIIYHSQCILLPLTKGYRSISLPGEPERFLHIECAYA
jgi:hypothetical protein